MTKTKNKVFVHPFVSLPSGALTLKSLKTFEEMSEETLACRANVYVGSKKVGYISNQGHGGDTFCHWTDRAIEEEFHKHVKALKPCQSRIASHKGDDGEIVYIDSELDWTSDFYFSSLVDFYEQDKFFNRACKAGKATVVFSDLEFWEGNIVDNEAPTSCVTYPYVYGAKLRAHLEKVEKEPFRVYNETGTLRPGIVFPTAARMKTINPEGLCSK